MKVFGKSHMKQVSEIRDNIRRLAAKHPKRDRSRKRGELGKCKGCGEETLIIPGIKSFCEDCSRRMNKEIHDHYRARGFKCERPNCPHCP